MSVRWQLPSVALFSCLALACTSGELSSDGDDAGDGALVAEEGTGDLGLEGGDVVTLDGDRADARSDAAEASPCGVVACDESKAFYAKIRDAYDRLGGASQLGAPHDNGGGIYVHPWGPGKTQDFDGGALGPVVLAQSDSPADFAKSAYAVRGSIRVAWLAAGGGPAFGYPIEDEHAGPGGEVQRFEKGCIGPDGGGGYGAYAACESPGDLAPVVSRVGSELATYAPGTQDALGVVWLPTGERWTYAGDERHVSASSMKFVWAMAALAAQPISAVEPPALPTFKDSNNSTAGQLIDLAGGPNAVNDFTSKTLGIAVDQLSLCNWSFDKTRHSTNCSLAMGGDNFFTPNAVLDFLSHVWTRDPVSADKGQKLLDWSLLSPRTGYGGWLGTQLPDAARAGMHHKAGWLPPGCCSSDATYNDMNEIGIVPTPRGSYAVTILVAHAPDYWGKQQQALEWASCVLYHAFAKDVADPFAAGCTHG